MNNFRRILKNSAYLIIFPALLFFCGCASLNETCKKIWGSSIEHLEEVRAQGKAQIFDLSINDSFERVEKILRYNDVDIYLNRMDKGYMAAMNFKGHVDTTQAGIFFTKIDESKTKIEIASMSPSLVLEVSEMIFDGLKNFDSVQCGGKNEKK